MEDTGVTEGPLTSTNTRPLSLYAVVPQSFPVFWNLVWEGATVLLCIPTHLSYSAWGGGQAPRTRSPIGYSLCSRF